MADAPRTRAARLVQAGGKLEGHGRFAAGAAAALLATMFLPWYEKSFVPQGGREFKTDTITAFGAVSFVEAAIFLVSAGVLVLVLTRAEGARFHLPGGDGTVIFAAGLWAAALIFYRVFDRPDVTGDAGTVGIQWGFFVAFVAAGALAYAGHRMRAASRPQAPVRERRTPRTPPPPAPPDWGEGDAEGDTAVVPASEARTQVAPRETQEPREPHATREARPPREPRPPRDRAVRREDARLTVDDPPDPPQR